MEGGVLHQMPRSERDDYVRFTLPEEIRTDSMVAMLHLMSASERAVYLVANVTPEVREAFFSSLAPADRPREEAAMMKWMTPMNGGLQRAQYLDTLDPVQRSKTEGYMLAHEDPAERESYLQANTGSFYRRYCLLKSNLGTIFVAARR